MSFIIILPLEIIWLVILRKWRRRITHLLRWLTAETRRVIIFLALVTFLVMDTRPGESGLMETLIHVSLI